MDETNGVKGVRVSKVIELDWIMKNRDLLDKDDYRQLQSYDLFNQYDKGELHGNGIRLVEALGLVIGLYEKYVK